MGSRHHGHGQRIGSARRGARHDRGAAAMSAGGDIDWPQLAEPVARAVWGDPVARRCRSAGNREGAAVTTDLLGDISLEGIVVELDRGCAWCGSNALVIVGSGA